MLAMDEEARKPGGQMMVLKQNARMYQVPAELRAEHEPRMSKETARDEMRDGEQEESQPRMKSVAECLPPQHPIAIDIHHSLTNAVLPR